MFILGLGRWWFLRRTSVDVKNRLILRHVTDVLLALAMALDTDCVALILEVFHPGLGLRFALLQIVVPPCLGVRLGGRSQGHHPGGQAERCRASSQRLLDLQHSSISLARIIFAFITH